MKLIVCPTAYKGTLTPWKAARVMEQMTRAAHPRLKITVLPLADGGDGTLEVLLKGLKGKVMRTRVRGPLGKPVNARWGLLPKKTAIIEMARASGLALVKGRNRVLEATTYGTGELIRAALKQGCRTILIGVGGTATSDGGAGALQALGLRYFDKHGRELNASPRDLLCLHRIDWNGLRAQLEKTNVFVLCDVTNPLLGPKGSARTYGPQKGATPKQVELLEKALKHWSTFSKFQVKDRPGVGAAGALAYGLAAFVGAKLVRGAPFIMKTLRWKEKSKGADFILTGEGRLDKTSFQGKVIGEIVKQRGRARVGVICGSNALTPAQLKKHHLHDVIAMNRAGLKTPQKALRKALKRLL